MAKREKNFFNKINSDEELEMFLQHQALIVLDVYQDLYGPCATSLHGTLENAKASFPHGLRNFDAPLTEVCRFDVFTLHMRQTQDKLQLAVCDAGKMEKLKRFRGKSLPIIVFCDEQKVIDIAYGANIPLLASKIKNHLQAREKGERRLFYDFDEPLPFERIELDRIQAEKDETEKLKREKHEKELFEKLDSVIELMKDHANDNGVTLFMPHVADIAWRKTAEAARFSMIVGRARKTVQIVPEQLLTLNYKLENPLDEDIINYLYGKDLMAVLWSVDPRKSTPDVLSQFVQDVSEPKPILEDEDQEPNSTEVMERVLDPLIVYLDVDDESPAEQNVSHASSNLIDDLQSQHSIKLDETKVERITQESSGFQKSVNTTPRMTLVEYDRPKLVIPPVWTPSNQEGNFMLMYTFFSNQFEYFLRPVLPPEPPHVCMIFPAAIREELFSLVNENKNEILAHGFFTSDDFQDCELICKTPQKYEEMQENSSDVIILKVAKRTSLMELTLGALDPLYVSQNPTTGAQECSLVFNESFDEVQDVLTKK